MTVPRGNDGNGRDTHSNATAVPAEEEAVSLEEPGKFACLTAPVMRRTGDFSQEGREVFRRDWNGFRASGPRA